jgi:hypothetical protein
MNELSESSFTLNIREHHDSESDTQRIWVIDVLDLRGNVLIEGAGVASGLPLAIEKAGYQIAHLLADEWNLAREEVAR